MNIGIIGLGGVGGYYGGKLVQLMSKIPTLNVYFVARGAHFEAIQQNGLQLQLAEDGKTYTIHPTKIVSSISDLPKLDLCLIAVKSYDLEDVVTQLKDKVHTQTEILPLLNGVGIYERIRAILPNPKIYSACVYIMALIEKPGFVVESGGHPKIVFGPDLKRQEHSENQWKTLLDKANINYVFTEDHLKEIWTKYMYISPYALVTARYHKSVGAVYEGEETRAKVQGIMKEIEAIAHKLGIPLDIDVVERSLHLAQKFDFHATTSFQRDYVQPGKKNEKELFGKAILDYGKRLGIPTPVTEEVYQGL